MVRAIRVITGAAVTAVLTAGMGNAAHGQVPAPPKSTHPLAQIMIEVETLRIEAVNLHIWSEYCKPPLPPLKIVTEAQIRYLNARLKQADELFRQAQAGYGRARSGEWPIIDGLLPAYTNATQTRNYFAAARRHITEVFNILAGKKAQLNARDEKDCAKAMRNQPTQKPPDDPDPPPAASPIPARPVPRPITFPELPEFFCSQEEKRKFVNDIRRTLEEPILDNLQDATGYARAVFEHIADLSIQDAPESIIRNLEQTEGRWADKNVKDQRELLRRYDRFVSRVVDIPVIDCTPPPRTTPPGGMPPTPPAGGGAATPPPPTGQTEISIDAGIGMPTNPSGGNPIPLPDPTVIETPNGRQTREVPSHSYGPGADQINGLSEGKIQPLDPAFMRNNSKRKARIRTRARVARRVNRVVGVWGEVGIFRDALGFSPAALATVEATRSSLEDTFTALTAGAMTRTVSATTTYTDGSGAGMMFGGGVELNLAGDDATGVRPFVRAGLGFLPAIDSAATATVVLDYQFTLPGSGAPFHETDTAIIRTRSSSAVGLQLGGGVKKAITNGIDLVLGWQTSIYPNRIEVTLETNPTRVTGTPPGLVTFSAPGAPLSLLMSNVPQVNSSLSMRMPETTTFKGSDMLFISGFSIGVSFRY